MSSLETIGKSAMGLAAMGIVAIGGYSSWKCYKKRGSLYPSDLAVCFFEGLAGAAGSIVKDTGTALKTEVKKEDKQFHDPSVKVSKKYKKAIKKGGPGGMLSFQSHYVGNKIGKLFHFKI